MATTTAPADLAFHLPRCPRVTGADIAELLESEAALLLQRDEDGAVEVAARQLPGTVVLRTHAWAADLQQTALAAALEQGQTLRAPSIRKAAALAGNTDLAREHAELASFIAEAPAV